MLDLLNILNDVMRTDPWFSPYSAPVANAAPTLHADVAETDAEYWIDAELPGVLLENVKLAIENDVLMLTVEKRLGPDDRCNYHHVERRYGTVSRGFRLPQGIQSDQVQATLKDGVLSVRLPKAEHARPRRIPVHVGTLSSGEVEPRQITASASSNDE